MYLILTPVVIGGSSPAAAGQAVSSAGFTANLALADLLVIDAQLGGQVGGVLDVYVQRKAANNTWFDWIHFPQIAAATTRIFTTSMTASSPTGIFEIGSADDAGTGTPVLAVNTNTGVNPFYNSSTSGIRLLYVAGAGTAAGGDQTVTIRGYRNTP